MTATNGEKPRNVYQRKLAVMGRCKEISPDKTHPHHHFEYVSIQNVENHLREFCIAEGLDVTPSVENGDVVVTLTNVEKPDEQIVTRWPVVEGDKGWAYSVKYPLMRIFHVGDGEENDEKEMADKSARTTQRSRQEPPAPARAETGRPTPVASAAPSSGEIATVAVADEALRLFDAIPAREKWGIVSAFGWQKGRNLSQWMRGLSPESVVAVRNALDSFLQPDPVVDPAEIPF